MKAIVLKVEQIEESQIIVELQTEFGNLSGFFHGDVPQVLATVNIEIEFETLTYRSEVEPKEFSVRSPSVGEIELVGQVDSWIGALAYLRIGPSLISIDMQDQPIIGSWIFVTGKGLKFYDQHL